MKNKLIKTSLLCMAVLATGQAFAVYTDSNPGYDPGLIDNTNFVQGLQYHAREKVRATKDPAYVEEEVRQKMDLLNTEQVSFKLKDIQITGNTVFPTYVLMRLVDFKIGQDVTINDLIMSANEITDYYQSKGYISTIAYLPPQKVQNGRVEIKVLEGKYGNVEINPGHWERSSYLNKKYLKDNNIAPGKVLNVKDVRNALTDMNSEEYMKGKVSFADNEESEEYSDVTLDVKDRFPINLDLRYDNQGRDAIGTQRGVLYAGLHDVTGHGDTLMGTLAASKHSLGVGGMYSLPIAENDTRLNLGYSYSHVSLKNALRMYGIKGDSHDYFVGVSRRLAKGDDYRLYGDITFDWRDTETKSKYKEIDNLLHQRYRSRVLRGTLTDVKDDQYGRWLFTGSVAGGIPVDASDYRMTKSKPSNSFVKLNAGAARLQVLPHNQLAILQVNGQYANRHMFASEAMQVGGMNSVRGYDEGYYIGDYGMTASFEYRVPLIPGIKGKYKFISDSIQLAGFYDFGWVGNRYQGTAGFRDGTRTDYLMSAGPGIVVKLTKYISANMYWGFPIGPSTKNYAGAKDTTNCRFHFMVTSNIL
ncbi:ShlB/FhaC/HecB family hemolysin secretion/activation protein [bacterium]|nr:ShlB/FhaC/HecB family hemolysin secretion/activation protein [bacterium]